LPNTASGVAERGRSGPSVAAESATLQTPSAYIPAHFEIFDRASCLPSIRSMTGDKRFVYVLRNADETPQFYVGLTSDVRARLTDPNAGRCPHTASRRPWQLHVMIEFSDEQRAVRFEHYLKSGSGRAFAKRHFEP
jgi:putative endonuclease